MAAKLSHHEALIYVMVTMSMSDGSMSDDELRRIGDQVQRLPVFRDFDEERLVDVAQACGAMLSKESDGLGAMLDLVHKALPATLRETAYALAVEIAAADLKVAPEEMRFLDRLRDKLEISKLVVAAIERGARARHRTV
jgi:tellurite resistance protein